MLSTKDLKNITMIIDRMYGDIKFLTPEECDDLLEKLDEEKHARQVREFMQMLNSIDTEKESNYSTSFFITYGQRDVEIKWCAQTYNAIYDLLKEYEEEL